jgi:hypothetical protein
MTHILTVQAIDMLWSYFVCPERKSIVEIRACTRSRKIRRGSRFADDQLQHRDKPIITADFSDPHSQCVLEAVANALVGPLALQAARDDEEADWLASQQGRT